MIWTAIIRGTALFSLLLAVKEYYDLTNRDIKPNRIYSARETAQFLGTDRIKVLELLRSNQLHGKRVGGNYRIPGQSILDYLEK